jgi:hypothetical protein
MPDVPGNLGKWVKRMVQPARCCNDVQERWSSWIRNLEETWQKGACMPRHNRKQSSISHHRQRPGER